MKIIILFFQVFISLSVFAETKCGLISVMAMEEVAVKMGGTPKTTIEDVNKDINLLKKIISTGSDGQGTKFSAAERQACKIQLVETENFKKQKFTN